ncbi:hypothetical protein [Plantactinospora sp. KBS50]|uniref:hypothetical protein n=1 Tax=Plantactinospora sp. KBS50 TaxID=2024580 RepID=UPI000BAB0F39|nr:hypothetical protein [Plantactinospora sp. KBS50]ASW55545.1 hypothetical protein CIK06_17240 [Plantactinospora sp. KBS50]
MNSDDRALLAELRSMWETADPVPADLATRALFLLELDDLDVELMSPSQELATAGARGAESISTITFASDQLTVMVTISHSGPQRHRLDGWLAPGVALRVDLRAGSEVRENVADANGRFVFTDVPSGFFQLVIHPTDHPAVRLTRPLVTPATQL